MDFPKLTIKAQEAFASAQGTPYPGNPELTPDHLLRPCSTRRRASPPRILEKAGFDPARCAPPPSSASAALPRIEGATQQPPASRALRQRWSAAFTEAEASRTSTSPSSTCCWRSPSAGGLDRAAPS